jgi:hypothetical protein
VDSLRFAFPLLGELIGAELDDLALDYLAARAGHTDTLERFVRAFGDRVTEAYREHRWAGVVRDVVALEIALMDLRDRPGAEGSCLRIMRWSEPAFLRGLAARAGVALDWSGEPGADVAVVRRGFDLYAIFLRPEQRARLERLDGADRETAAARMLASDPGA